jgi:diguanylate cyclase (GGDEF)-like protein
MAANLMSPQGITLERLLGYVREELLPGSENIEKEILPYSEEYLAFSGTNILSTVASRIDIYLASFFTLMLPSLVSGDQINEEETSLMGEELKREVLEQFCPRLSQILYSHIPLNQITRDEIYDAILFEKKMERGYNSFLKKYATLANTDYVTGLSLRHVFERKLGSNIEHLSRKFRRHDDQIGNFTLVYIDLNNLGKINDEYGHSAGDAYLRAVSEKIREIMRNEDSIARIGGDEITVICDDVNPDIIAKKIAERYQEICDYANEKIREVVESEGKEFEGNAMISVGLASSEGCNSVEEIKRRADSVLYLSKVISKSPELENSDKGRMFYQFTLLNCNPPIIIRNAPSPEQIIQIYNPDYDFIEEGVRGVGNVVYQEAKNTLPRKK